MERSAFFRKDRLVDKGDEITVVGVLLVKRYPANFINCQFVPPWTEVRISPA